MNGEKLRKVFEALTTDDAKPTKGGGFERPGEMPPYMVAPGTHKIDKRMSLEAAAFEEAQVEIAKREAAGEISKFGGYGSLVGDWVPETQGGPNALPSADDVHTLFTMAGALFPAYDPEVLSSLQEHSNSLRPNVDAYKTNIDGFGYTLEPIVDLTDPDADEKIGDALYLDRMHSAELRGEPAAPYPTDEEIASYKKELKALMRIEKARVEGFFGGCAGELSFKELRRRTREDYEITGNAYWEVLRNAAGEIAEFHHVPSYSMRLAPIEHVLRPVTVKRRVSPFRYEPVEVKKRFRRFIQVVLDRIVYFKEFGDTRCISKRTGRVWPSAEELMRESQHDGPATEILHFRIFSPRSPYGVPRWIGNLLSVLGSRASEEVNYLYFDNKAVPPLALLVSGGKLAEAATEKIESFIADNVRGKENFHKILVVEAEPASNKGAPQVETGRIRIELVPLRDAQQDDALFQDYDAANRDKVGQSFRVPRLLRGDAMDINRATADAALEFAEVQVFQGEREGFDDIVNMRLFPELGIRFWVFKSNSPVNRDASDLTTNLTKISGAGIITLNEAREVASDVFNRKFPKLEEPWADQPVPFTLAGYVVDPSTGVLQPLAQPGDTDPFSATASPPATPPSGKSEGDEVQVITPGQRQRDLLTLAGRVMALRDSLGNQSRASYKRELLRKHAADVKPEHVLTLKVDPATFQSWFEKGDGAASPPAAH